MNAQDFRQSKDLTAAHSAWLVSVHGIAAIDALKSQHPLSGICKGNSDQRAVLSGAQQNGAYLLGEVAGYEKALRNLQSLAESQEGRSEPRSKAGGRRTVY